MWRSGFLMKKYTFIFSSLLFFKLSLYGDVPQAKELADLAQRYAAAIEDYKSKPLGLLEQNAKNSLRNSYLACSASDNELLYKLGAYTEVVRRVKQWCHKCSRGLSHKIEPSVTTNQFVELAQNYATLHKQVSQSPEYQNHQQAHYEYKKAVMHLLKQGYSIEQINLTLKSYGISHPRVLSRTEYWKKKDL